MTMKISKRKTLAVIFLLGSGFMVRSALAQGTTDPQGMLQSFSDASVNWQTAIYPYALSLFKLLAAVDFAWTCIVLALEKSDAQALTAGIINKLMTIGIFFTLLAFAPQWFPLIIQSFVQIGGSASGTATPLNPSDILKMGLTIAGSLLNAASQTTSLLTGFATSLSLIFAAAVIVISYVVITVHFVMAMVESYVVIGAGYIFLGFGGSRWTSPLAEKYVSQVVSVGARLMVLYLVIGLGQQFANHWIAMATVAANGASANISLSWNVAAEVAMYAIICWTVPKLVSNVIGGTLSASGGDAIGFGVAAGTAALSVAALASGVGAPAAAAGGTAASGAGGFGGGGAVAAPSGSGAVFQPPPPSGASGAPSTSPASPGQSSTRSLGPGPGPALPSSGVAQVPPPASALKVQDGLNKAKELIQSVHGSLPSDGAVASGAGLNIGHPGE
jgi:type IV secretion system protein TrbL